MELIDKETVYKELSEYYHHTAFIQHLCLSEALDRVPVVDAIPVEWLSKLADECAKSEDPYVQINGLLINVVINKWEERIEEAE